MTEDAVNPEPIDEEPRSGRWAAWIVVAVVLIAAAIAAQLLMGSSSREEQPGSSSPIKQVLALDTFVVNLSDPDERAYLRVGVSLGLDRRPSGKDPIAVAPLRDSIVGVLAAAKPADLLTVDGKVKLKADLLHALQDRAPLLGVREVYFTEFLIQR